MNLPVDAALPELLDALRSRRRAVLTAPPGSGKTTRVPLALMEEREGIVIMLEPRRLAARSAARFMAAQRGEKAGASIGYRVRLESAVSRATRVEIVTEGVLTRWLIADPELSLKYSRPCGPIWTSSSCPPLWMPRLWPHGWTAPPSGPKAAAFP